MLRQVLPLALLLAVATACGDDPVPVAPPAGNDAGLPADKCAGTSCLPGETCDASSGNCACSPGSCPAPAVCDPATLRCANKCAGVQCNQGESCDETTGTCRCTDTSCPSDRVCDASRRCTTACTAGSCQPGESCDPVTGICSCTQNSCLAPAACDPVSSRCINKCATVTCNPGESCDPLSGVCSCTQTSCAAPAFCDPGTKHCVNKCSGVTCNPGESCDGTSGLCACTATSCGADARCNAQNRCEPKCTGVTCDAGESCVPTTGICACTSAPNSCPAGKKCDNASSKCIDNCLGVTCATPGESCNATTGLCACTTGPDSCTAADASTRCGAGGTCVSLCSGVTCAAGESCNPGNGQCECAAAPNDTCQAASSANRCDAGSKRCVPVCQGVTCSAGETCNPTTGGCQCGPGTCPIGQICNGSLRCESNAPTCGGVSCNAGEACNTGTQKCECTAAPNSCPNGQVCDGTTLRCRSSTNLCAGVLCANGETCNPASGVCECSANSCPAGQTCNAQLNCVSTTNPCQGVTCNTGESCNATSGICECTSSPESCPAPQVCGANRRCAAPADPCAGITCPAGETCSAGKCGCTSTSCPAGSTCGSTGHCQTSCGGTLCQQGQGCYDPSTGVPGGTTCTCLPAYNDSSGVYHPDTCASIGMRCDYDYTGTASTCRLPEERETCQPGVGCATGHDCQSVTLPGGTSFSLCLARCNTTSQCPNYFDTCVKNNPNQPGLENHCWLNSCGLDAQGQVDRTKYFQPCNAEGTNDGTCLPLDLDGEGAGLDSGYCYTGGAVAQNGTCNPEGDRSKTTAATRCGLNGVCIQTGATTGICKALCNGAPNPNPVQACGAGELCADISGLDTTREPLTARVGICEVAGGCAATCPSGEGCNQYTGACQCSANSCPPGQTCSSGFKCVGTATNCVGVTCNAGETCNGFSGACECTENSCGAAEACDPVTKRCVSKCAACPAGTACDASGNCISEIGQPCATDTECGTNGRCIPGSTVPPYQFTSGYCVADCTGGAACPSGSSCFTFNREDASGNPVVTNWCYQTCSADAQCRTAEDYQCMQITDTTTQTACYSSSSNAAGAPVGSACAQDHDCFARGACYPQTTSTGEQGVTGGYCTRFTCDLDGFCPSGSFCGGSVCYKSCTTSATCGRAGFDCQGQGLAQKFCWETTPVGSVPVGASCTGSAQCGNGFCLNGASFGDGTPYTTGLCSAFCSDANACPTGSKCVGYNTTSAGTTTPAVYSLCAKSCTSDTQCGGAPFRCDLTPGSPFQNTCVKGCASTLDCDPQSAWGGFYSCGPTVPGGSVLACLPH